MCSDYHSIYRRVLPWQNAKAPRTSLQSVSPTSDAAQSSMTLPFHGFLLFLGVF